MEIVERIFHDGTVRYEAFLLKIVFTAITVGAGFKGGEFVPALFTGATLGGALAGLIGLSPALGAAVGMAALIGGVTACPLATVVLCVELFDGKALLFLALAAAIGCFLSGRESLYGEIGFAMKLKNQKSTA
jgi:H+/Cl- antiporter ClcA